MVWFHEKWTYHIIARDSLPIALGGNSVGGGGGVQDENTRSLQYHLNMPTYLSIKMNKI